MSLYIRTGNGIFKGNNVKLTDNYIKVWKTIDGQRKCEEFWIITRSDNLEDLIDEYVVDCKHKDSIKKHPFIYTLPKNIKAYYLDLSQEIQDATTIYGAIWTSKGLIYVAKMNKDGEWELI